MLFSTWRAWEKEGEEAFRGVRKRGLALFVFWGAKKRQYFGLYLVCLRVVWISTDGSRRPRAGMPHRHGVGGSEGDPWRDRRHVVDNLCCRCGMSVSAIKSNHRCLFWGFSIQQQHD